MSYICLINFPNDENDYSIDCISSLMKLKPDGIILAREVSDSMFSEYKKITKNVIKFEPFNQSGKTLDMTNFVKYTLKCCLDYNNGIKQFLSNLPIIKELSTIIGNMITIKDVTFIPSYWYCENESDNFSSATIFKMRNIYFKCKYSFGFFDSHEKINRFAIYRTTRILTNEQCIEFFPNTKFLAYCKASREKITKRRREERQNLDN